MVDSKLIYLFHALVVGPVLFWIGWTCGHCTCKCIPKWLNKTLLVTGVVVVLYHFYSYILAMKRENFVHEGGSLGLPLWGVPVKQAFTDFSFPYQRNDHCFYSYHDTVNKRKCPCDPVTGVCTCQPNGNCTRSQAQDASTAAKPVVNKDVVVSGMESFVVNNKESFTGSMDNEYIHAGVVPSPGAYSYGVQPVSPVMGRNPMI
jgi:hypothetical protein